jgi:hypothetical protein
VPIHAPAVPGIAAISAKAAPAAVATRHDAEQPRFVARSA